MDRTWVGTCVLMRGILAVPYLRESTGNQIVLSTDRHAAHDSPLWPQVRSAHSLHVMCAARPRPVWAGVFFISASGSRSKAQKLWRRLSAARANVCQCPRGAHTHFRG